MPTLSTAPHPTMPTNICKLCVHLSADQRCVQRLDVYQHPLAYKFDGAVLTFAADGDRLRPKVSHGFSSVPISNELSMNDLRIQLVV